MSFPWRPFLIGLIGLGLLLRVLAIGLWKEGLTHDESVSYLCAAATQGRYERELPRMLDQPLQARDVQAFYARPQQWSFGVVAHDLAHDDIHPPLYFWMLHGIHRVVGFDMRSGMVLNTVLTSLLLILLVRHASGTLGPPNAPLAVAALWSLSPAVMLADLEARHYQLLGLIAFAMYIVGRRFWQGTARRADLVLFTLINAAGFLTHYYYGFLLFPGLALVIYRHRNSAVTWRYLTSLFMSLILFIGLYPGIFDFIPNYLNDPEQVAGGKVDHLFRLKALLAAMPELISHGSRWKWSFLLVLTIMVWVGRKPGVRKVLSALKGTGPAVDLCSHCAWYLFFSGIFYLSGVSPTQAVGGAYFSYLWPLVVLLLAHLSERYVRPSVVRMLYLGLTIQLVAVTPPMVRHSSYLSDLVPREATELMRGSSIIVTDEGRRGQLPRMAIRLVPGSPLRVVSAAGARSFMPQGTPVSYWMVAGTTDGRISGITATMTNAGYRSTTIEGDGHVLAHFERLP